MLKIITLILLLISVIFVLHVPVLKYLSKPGKNSELNNYPHISADVESENFEMLRIFYGNTFGVWYDQLNELFIVLGQIIQGEDLRSGGRYLFYINLDGRLVKRDELVDGQYDELRVNDQYIKIGQFPEKKYVPMYRFKDLENIVELVHFEKHKFTWPYFYYFIPVVPFDWDGTAYIKLRHQADILKFKLPQSYYSRMLYLDGHHDGQLYYYPFAGIATDIGFFQISESSYHTVFGSGKEIHRDGYGVYVIRRKK